MPNALPLGAVRYDDSIDFDSTTPRLTVDWQATDDLMLYGIFAQGAKPGGLNGVAGQSIDKPTYAQEESDNFEIGVKLKMFENRLRMSTAAYYTKATDVQFTQSVPAATGQGAVTSVVTNQGEGEIIGLELEVQAAISEANQHRAHQQTNEGKNRESGQFDVGCAHVLASSTGPQAGCLHVQQPISRRLC